MVISTVITLTCPICRDVDEDANMVVTQCGHAFHSACMNNWKDAQSQRGGPLKCPYCSTYQSKYYDSSYIASSSSTIRLHSLTLRRAIIIEDGEASPEEELKNVRQDLDSTKVSLNKAIDKVRLQEADLVQIRLDKTGLETTISKLKTESKAQTNKLTTVLNELKTEKNSRQKHLGDKERMQKRIDDANSYIDKLKAERLEINGNLFAVRADNANIRSLSDRQAHMIKQLQFQLAALTRDKNALQTLVNANKGEKSMALDAFNMYPNVLNNLNGGFQRLEKEYLALKELFAKSQSLGRASIAQPQRYPAIHEPPINPALLQPIESGSFSWKSRDMETPDSTNSLPNRPSEVEIGKGNPLPNLPSQVELGKGSGRKKGKHRAANDKSKTKNFLDNRDVINSSGRNQSQHKSFVKDQDPIITSKKKQEPIITSKKKQEPIITTSDNNLAKDNSEKKQDPIITTSDNNLAKDQSMKGQEPIISLSNQPTQSGASKGKEKADQAIIEPQLHPTPTADMSNEDTLSSTLLELHFMDPFDTNLSA